MLTDMKYPNLRTIFILALIGGAIFWGCTTSQTSPPVQNGSQPGTSTEEVGEYETDSPADNEPLTDNETSVGSAEETSTSTAAEAAPTLILVADKINTLDPYQMVSLHPEGSVASHLWDTLTLLNDDLQIEPHLAESWRVVNNFTWEIKLRRDINFHNGEPVNAEAVRFSIERAQSTPGSLETFDRDVALEKVEIVDDYTLRLTSKQPVVNLPYHLAFLEILPPVYYSETNSDLLAVTPIGSGPYQLSEVWTPNETLVLEAVPTYWKGAPDLTRLIFETVPLPDKRLEALRLEEATLVTDLPPMPVDEWNSLNSKLEAIESTQRMFVGIHVEEESPLADKQVRQALNYGVNVEQIVEDWLEGYGEPYGSWVNPPANNPDLAPWPYDPDLARELLTEAGYGGGFTMTLRTPAGGYHNDAAIAEIMAQQLSELGITMQVDSVSNWGIYVRQLLTDDTADLFLLGLNSRGDGLEDVKNLSINFPFNPGGWQNESFEELLERGTNTFNEDSRNRHLNEAQAVAYEDAPWIWLWRPYDFYGVSQNLDWTPRRDGLVNLYKSTPDPADSTE